MRTKHTNTWGSVSSSLAKRFWRLSIQEQNLCTTTAVLEETVNWKSFCWHPHLSPSSNWSCRLHPCVRFNIYPKIERQNANLTHWLRVPIVAIRESDLSARKYRQLLGRFLNTTAICTRMDTVFDCTRTAVPSTQRQEHCVVTVQFHQPKQAFLLGGGSLSNASGFISIVFAKREECWQPNPSFSVGDMRMFALESTGSDVKREEKNVFQS